MNWLDNFQKEKYKWQITILKVLSIHSYQKYKN